MHNAHTIVRKWWAAETSLATTTPDGFASGWKPKRKWKPWWKIFFFLFWKTTQTSNSLPLSKVFSFCTFEFQMFNFFFLHSLFLQLKRKRIEKLNVEFLPLRFKVKVIVFTLSFSSFKTSIFGLMSKFSLKQIMQQYDRKLKLSNFVEVESKVSCSIIIIWHCHFQ